VADEKASSKNIKLAQLQTFTLSAGVGSFNLNKSGVFCPNMQLDIIISDFSKLVFKALLFF
jgi:hypothetical protein